jgi:hypothetical protein
MVMKPTLLRWLVRSTPPEVVAEIMGSGARRRLARHSIG